VGEERWFYRSAEEWIALAERLKQMPCPHCKVVGALIRQGYLRGYDESSSQRKTVRARRIFCSNRQARRGCGRTLSVWCADKIRRLSLTTGTSWRFLHRAVAGSLLAAIRTAHCDLSDRTWGNQPLRGQNPYTVNLGKTAIRIWSGTNILSCAPTGCKQSRPLVGGSEKNRGCP
jgi:hypothetical protein